MDRSLILRAQEIAARSQEPITDKQALAAAFLERWGDNPKMMAEVFAESVGWAVKVAPIPHLPKQLGLFPEVPTVIVNQTPAGRLLIPRAKATAEHVEKFFRFGHRVHRRQAKRFERGLESHLAAGFDPERNYDEQRAEIERRHRDDEVEQ